jgi:hypothetical protein
VIAPVRRSRPLRVILDTNVLLSGIFFGGVPGRLLTAWQDERLALVLSPAILAECHEATALAARYPALTAPLDSILTLLAQTATIRSGWFSTSRKSADFRCASRCFRARLEARRLIVASNCELSGRSSSATIVPSNSVNRPLNRLGSSDAAPHGRCVGGK